MKRRHPKIEATVFCNVTGCEQSAPVQAFVLHGGVVIVPPPHGWSLEQGSGYDPYHLKTHVRWDHECGYRCPLHPESKETP